MTLKSIKNKNSFLIFSSYLSLFMAAPFFIFLFSFLAERKFTVAAFINGITLFMLVSFLPFLISGFIYLKCLKIPDISKYPAVITCILFPALLLIWFEKGIPFLHSEAMFGPADGPGGALYHVAIFFGLIFYIIISLIILIIIFWLIKRYPSVNYHYFTLPCLLICGISMSISSFYAYRSLNGFCEQEARYMSENEKLHIALDALMLQASQTNLETYSPNWRRNQPSVILIEHLQDYTSSQQFLDEHPTCCELRLAQTFLWGKQFGGEDFSYGDPLERRLRGQLNGWLIIQNAQSFDSIVLNNCGKPVL